MPTWTISGCTCCDSGPCDCTKCCCDCDSITATISNIRFTEAGGLAVPVLRPFIAQSETGFTFTATKQTLSEDSPYCCIWQGSDHQDFTVTAEFLNVSEPGDGIPIDFVYRLSNMKYSCKLGFDGDDCAANRVVTFDDSVLSFTADPPDFTSIASFGSTGFVKGTPGVAIPGGGDFLYVTQTITNRCSPWTVTAKNGVGGFLVNGSSILDVFYDLAIVCNDPPPMMMARASSPERTPILPCVNLDDELLTSEIAAKGLDTRKRWFRCTADHGQHCCFK